MAPSVWQPPQARLRGCRRVLALTVRPCDVLVAAGGLVQRLAADGAPVDVLLATDGDAERGGGGDAFVRLGLPELARHRLSLRTPIGAPGADDLVAALSELVGFDPEPGLFLVAPYAGDQVDGECGADRAAAGRAAERVAAIYHLPLLRYLVDAHRGDDGVSRLDLDPAEWTRKRKALAVYGPELAARCGPTETFLATASRPVGPQPVG